MDDRLNIKYYNPKTTKSVPPPGAEQNKNLANAGQRGRGKNSMAKQKSEEKKTDIQKAEIIVFRNPDCFLANAGQPNKSQGGSHGHKRPMRPKTN